MHPLCLIKFLERGGFVFSSRAAHTHSHTQECRLGQAIERQRKQTGKQNLAKDLVGTNLQEDTEVMEKEDKKKLREIHAA